MQSIALLRSPACFSRCRAAQALVQARAAWTDTSRVAAPNQSADLGLRWSPAEQYLVGCEPDRAPLRVAVLLSGGVDSSLSLALLKAAGHQVHAFYLQIWFQEDFRNFWDQCPWEDDLQYAQQVCDQHNVPLSVVPLTKEYWEQVVSHCVTEIKHGRTPNPDVLCNSRVKFGAFYDFLEENHAERFDRVASGHYARVHRHDEAPSNTSASTEPLQAATDGPSPSRGTRCELMLTPDQLKDQTYFLAHLSHAQLQRVMFPLGRLTKADVRQLARDADLPSKDRKDSQGLCFLGKVKFSEFVKEHLGEWPGPIVEEESNTVVGLHAGFWFYTIGQRSGLDLGHLPNGPWYVIRKDPLMNTVYVSLNYYSEDKLRNAFRCDSFNWINGDCPRAFTPEHAASQELHVKVRHGPLMYKCLSFELEDDGHGALVRLPENDQGLAAGQFAVFYDRGRCLGSGVISESIAIPNGVLEAPAR